jgi:voltage-gated potassium channel
MNGLLGSPLRNLASVILFMIVVVVLATAAYMGAGWSFSDAIYMVVLTVYTVGYGEVRPINTPYLHGLTIGTIVLGCTGMILVTGALVQVLTIYQIRQFLGENRVKSAIDQLKDHVIICGFGRIGLMLAKDLSAAGVAFVVLERGDARVAEARELGYLCLHGDATDETSLIAAGIERARIVATVLPDDAINVFITLSARSLNASLEIIARGEVPSTESKLFQAGANKVVLPTHIGAERIAELILFPETSRFVRGSERMRDFEKVLRDLGLDIEVIVVDAKNAMAGMTVEELERRAKGGLFVIQINTRAGNTILRPARDDKVEAGDSLVVVGKGVVGLVALFSGPRDRPKAGRTVF